MQLTRQSEYAIKIMIELAKHPWGEMVPGRIISENQDIPTMFLQKTVQLLAKSGLVTTQRGIQGGVRLSVPAEQVSIARVIEAIEGPFAINPCLSPGYVCPNMPDCRVRALLSSAQEALVKELKTKTIADLI